MPIKYLHAAILKIESLMHFFQSLISVVYSFFRYALISLLLVILMIPPSFAQTRSISIIRDAEIENTIKEIALPLLKAAGLGGRNINIIIVKNREFNAFVADSSRIFINMGAISQTDHPNQLAGVLAHEIGHMAGGHLNRLRERIKRTRTIAIASALLGAGATAAGAQTGNSGLATVGQAVTAGGQHYALRDLLAYQRSEEIAADRAAINYLHTAGQSAKGMIDVFEIFASQSMFTKDSADPYARSHPMPRDRINSTTRLAQKSRYFDVKDSQQAQLKYDLIKAKLYAYYASGTAVLRRYDAKRNDLPALYARAIATYRTQGVKKALPLVDRLIQSAPSYPYFHEFKAQILFETGNANQAISAAQKAVSLKGDVGMFRVLLGRAYLAKGGDGNLTKAISQLEKGLRLDPLIHVGYQQLAMAYGQKGDIANAELTSAEGELMRNNEQAALRHAKRAQEGFSKGSPGWLKAGDILHSLGE